MRFRPQGGCVHSVQPIHAVELSIRILVVAFVPLPLVTRAQMSPHSLLHVCPYMRHDVTTVPEVEVVSHGHFQVRPFLHQRHGHAQGERRDRPFHRGHGPQYGLRVTAEGVETQEQLERLQSINCDRAQGYMFSKPMAPVQKTPET